MNRPLAGMAVALGLLAIAAAEARAAAPTISGTVPFGARRGVSTPLKVEGANLKGNPELIAPFRFETASPPSANPETGHWESTIVVDPATPLGVYPVRVRTEDGISNPILFAVGQLPQVAEAEDNSTFETAQPVAAPAVVEGQAASNDVDFYRFAGKKGQKIVVDAQCARIGSGVDPSIRLTTAGRGYVASADDTPGLLSDARLSVTLPEDGDYVVEVSDSRYQGGGRAIYRLIIGAVPMADEVFPIGGRRGETLGLELRGGTLPGVAVAAATLGTDPTFDAEPLRVPDPARLSATAPEGPDAPRLDVESLPPAIVDDLPALREPADPASPTPRAAPPVALHGRIDPAGDEDRFVLAVIPGQKLRIEVDASEHGSALDGVLQILGAKGAVLANADDTAPPPPPKGKKAPALASPDPSLDFTVPKEVNEVTLAFRDLGRRGGVGFPYRIRVVPAPPSFAVTLDDPQVSIPRAGTAVVGAAAARKGYDGPIALTVLDPPAGLTVRPGTIPKGQAAGSLTLSAADDVKFGVVRLAVIGRADGPDGPIVSAATKTIVFAKQTDLATSKRTQHGLLAAPALPTPVMLRTPEAPVEVAQGFGGVVPVEVARADGADAALVAAIGPAPPLGLTVGDGKIAEKSNAANVVLNAAADAPLGNATLALVAKGKFAGAELTVAAPEVTVNVVRPASLELAAPNLEVKAGEPAEIKGKVVRKGTFKDEVSVALKGLPAGLKAEPVKVPGDQSEFTLKVESESGAAAAEAKAEVNLAFQVAKKDYPTPPTPLAVKVVAPPKPKD